MEPTLNIEPRKSYATRINACKAVARFPAYARLRWFIYRGDDGRYTPVFVGESAVQAGAHLHFNVIG